MDYNSLLNEEQIKPVLDTEGAVLVLAGAGSGKTRVLTYRVAYLLDVKKVAPYNILAITFTNKAANEMKERVQSVTGQSDVWISTFHSFCAKILRIEIENLNEGYTSNYSIYTANDSTKLIARILKELGIDDQEIKKTIKWHISNAKNIGMSVNDYCNSISGNNVEIIRNVFMKYEAELKLNNALDFDDLLLKTVHLFKDCPSVLEKYQEKFQYIHIDEFQDTNKIQMLLVRMLAYKHQNIFVVGDDDQSIYGWRGAEIENILGFNSYFKDCRIYKLQRNYRSSENILNCANRVISFNSHRMGKELWTDIGKGANVIFKPNFDDKQEAEYVMREIDGLIRNNGYRYKDFAILVRINSLTRIFEEKLNMYGIKYKLIGGFKFYDRKEILDTIAYLRVIANPKDSESITRIINFPKRGIGETAVSKLREYCNIRNISFMEGVMNIEQNETLTNTIKKKFMSFKFLIEDLYDKSKSMAFTEFVDYMVEKIDFYSVYDMDNAEERNKLENIDEFITVIKEFCLANPKAGLDEFLQSIALISDSDVEEDDDYVTIATVHGVKGLEYRCVFIVGCENNIFPSGRARDSLSEMEEERRCMYVAITRAKERLYLTCAGNRFRFGKIENNLVSRFVEEAGLIKKTEEVIKPNAKTKYSEVGNAPDKFRESVKNDLGKDLSEFRIGLRVRHNKFGDGTIMSRSGETAEVAFDKLGVKNLNLRLAPIILIK